MIDGYRFVRPVPTAPEHFDAQGHLNNAAIVAMLGELRIAYARETLGVERAVVEAEHGRSIASAWLVQLLVADGRAVEFPEWYFEQVAATEGGPIASAGSQPRPEWGPSK